MENKNSQQEVPQKILDKIRKLLKLQQGAKEINSEGEAFAAAQAVQRLLTEYNLSLADVSDEDDEKQKIVETDDFGYTSQYGNYWKQSLMITIAHYNYTQVLGNGYKRKISLVGSEANVQICKELYDYLTKTFQRLAKKHLDEANAELNMQGKRYSAFGAKKFIRSYLEGACAGLEENYQQRQPTSEETALVVCHNEMINDFLSEKYHRDIKTTNIKCNSDVNESALMQGYNDGKSINLNSQIEQKGGAA